MNAEAWRNQDASIPGGGSRNAALTGRSQRGARGQRPLPAAPTACQDAALISPYAPKPINKPPEQQWILSNFKGGITGAFKSCTSMHVFITCLDAARGGASIPKNWEFHELKYATEKLIVAKPGKNLFPETFQTAVWKMTRMKSFQLTALLFLPACTFFQTAARLAPEEACLAQKIRVIDARGPNTEDSITVVTFETACGDKIKLAEAYPFRTGKQELSLTAIPRRAQASSCAKSIALNNEIRMALVNAMKQHASSAFHINTSSIANLRTERDRARLGSSREALPIMLINMQTDRCKNKDTTT